MKISCIISLITCIIIQSYTTIYCLNSKYPNELNTQIEYKNCADFNFDSKSDNCRFIKKLNTDIIALKGGEYYITRYYSSIDKIAGYDIIGDEEIEFFEIDYTKEIEAYLVYLEKENPHIIIHDFYD